MPQKQHQQQPAILPAVHGEPGHLWRPHHTALRPQPVPALRLLPPAAAGAVPAVPPGLSTCPAPHRQLRAPRADAHGPSADSGGGRGRLAGSHLLRQGAQGWVGVWVSVYGLVLGVGGSDCRPLLLPLAHPCTLMPSSTAIRHALTSSCLYAPPCPRQVDLASCGHAASAPPMRAGVGVGDVLDGGGSVMELEPAAWEPDSSSAACRWVRGLQPASQLHSTAQHSTAQHRRRGTRHNLPEAACSAHSACA